jgi:predicted GIY-YIG superfamily endonuclease
MNDPTQYTLYTLLLEGDKFYVGRVTGGLDAVSRRYEQHCRGEGSEWTRLHRPLKILATEDGTKEDEDRIVERLFKIHGKERVRGGSFSQVELDIPKNKGELRELKVRGAADACFKCGRDSHFASNCYARTEVLVAPACARCGRDSHGEEQCYAKTAEDGQRLPARAAAAPRRARSRSRSPVRRAGCSKCGRSSHVASQCYARAASGSCSGGGGGGGSRSSGGGSRSGGGGGRDGRAEGGCYRCGRTSHYASECYARL